jgi:hypothetical protein
MRGKAMADLILDPGMNAVDPGQVMAASRLIWPATVDWFRPRSLNMENEKSWTGW